MKQSLLYIKTYLQCLSVGVLTLCIGLISAESQNVYCVGPTATGNGSGADWSDLMAWSNTPNRGDTWYLVGGSYPAKTFSVTESGATFITIRKATVADHGGIATGWSDSLDSIPATFTGTIDFTTGYWVFDGNRTGGLWDQTLGDYGFNFSPIQYPIKIANTSRAIGNVTIAHIGAVAPTADVEKFFAQTDNSSLSVSNVTISTCFLNGWENGYWATSAGLPMYNWVFDHNVCINGSSTAAHHGEWVNNNYGLMMYQVTCFNLFIGPDGGMTGYIVANNWNNDYPAIYGNVFVRATPSNGIITGTSSGTINNAQVYNNTFINCSGSGGSAWLGGYTSPNSMAYNNLFYNMPAPAGPGYTQDYQAYFSASGYPNETHGQVATGNPFVNYSANNFELVSDTQPGIALPAPFNVDALGNIRSTWTRGAFEFTGSNTNPPPVNPILQVTPGSIGYGTVLVGASKTNSFTVVNAGTGTLSGNANVNAPFSVVGGASYSLGSGQTQMVTMVFNPSVANNYNQSVSFSGGSGTNTTVTGSATNVPSPAPIIQVTPGSIGYGTMLVGTSKTNSFTVQNVGTGTLSGNASVNAPFSVVGGGSYSLGSGQTQTVTVVFSPSVANNYSQSASFSGVSGTNVTVNGSATNALVVVPLITNSPPTIFTKTITASITNPITLQFATNLTSPTWQTIGVFAGSTNLSFTNMPAVFIRGVCSNLTGSVSLTWPPGTDPFLLGYNIYCGTASQTYTSMITVGKVTNLTIPNLIEGEVYYFAVKSYDLFGFTFQISSEISAMPEATGFSLTFTGQ